MLWGVGKAMLWCQGTHSQLSPVREIEGGYEPDKATLSDKVLRTSKPLVLVLGREILPRMGLFVPLSFPVARPVQSRFLWPPEHLTLSSPAFSPLFLGGVA